MQYTVFRPRTLLLAVTVLGLVGFPSWEALASDYTTAITASTPIAWYRLDPDANDSAGTHHGTASLLGVTFGEPGMNINGDDSNGSAGFVFEPPTQMGGVITVPTTEDLNFGTLDDFSIEFWAKRGESPFKQAVVNKGDTNGAFWMRFEADGKMKFNLDYGQSGSTVTSTNTYADDKWHHYVGVADRNEKVILYVDGQFAAETPMLGRGSVSTPGKDAYLGHLPEGPKNPANYWAGSLDEVAVYDAALNSSQIFNHYNSGTGGFGADPYDVAVGADSPIGWWRMANETDSGSGAHTCTAGTSVTFGQTTGIVGDTTGAMLMDGTDFPPITITDAEDLNFGTEVDFTIEAWVNVTAEGLPDEPHNSAMIFNKGDTVTSYWLRVQGDGTVRFLMDYGPTALDAQGGYVLDGGWHHVVGVADRDVGLELYVDSALVDTQGLFLDNDVSSDLDMQIGMLGAGDAFDGNIDELAIYDRMLTETDVLAHYTAAGYSISNIPGDADRNGTVDAADAEILAQNWGSSGDQIGWDQGDFNGDHVVNAADAAILAGNWGAGGGEAANAVPEPTTLAGLLILAAAVAFVIRRRGTCSA